MTTRYPIVFETEENGAISAYVPDLPVYAAAETHHATERAIRQVLAAYLAEHPDLPSSRTTVKVARVAATRRGHVVTIVGAGALVGHLRSSRTAAASRANGARGGRPRRIARGR